MKTVRIWRRGRWAFVWGTMLFAAAQAALAITIQYHRPDWRDPGFAFKRDLWQNHLHDRAGADGQPPVGVLMLGSSHTQHGLMPGRAEQLLDRTGRSRAAVFNFGQPGAGPVTQWLYLRRLLAAGSTPDLLLVEVSPLFLAGQLPAPFEQTYRDPDHLTPPERRAAQALGFWFPRSSWFGRLDELAPVCEMRAAFLQRLAPDWLARREDDQQCKLWMSHTDAGGWLVQPAEVTADQRRRLCQQTNVSLGYAFAGYHTNGPAVQALRKVLRLARGRGVPAVLVLMPEAPSFQALYPSEEDRELAELLHDLSAEYGAPVVNARDWISEGEFLDGHHLYRPGAERFTDRLTREVIGPWLEEKALRGS